MKVRAKFRCESVITYANGQATISLDAVTDGSEENKSFWKYTPNGRLEMTIDNKEAARQFVAGQDYYLDFTVAEEG